MIPLALVRPLAALAGVAALAIGFQLWVKSIEARGEARCQAGYAQAAIKGERANARTAILKAERNMEIADEQNRKAARDAAVAAGLRSQLERMRHDAAAARAAAASEPEASAGTDGAGQLRRLLAEGTERVERLGELAAEGQARIAELTRQVTGLQRYAAEVCGMEAKHDDDSR